MNLKELLGKVEITEDIKNILTNCKKLTIVSRINELVELAVKDEINGKHEVTYEVPGKGPITEAIVCKVKNGISANYPESYMRRRDPDCMVIGDDFPTDKTRYKEKYGKDFAPLRNETFDWLKAQELVVFIFSSGQIDIGIYSIVIAPANAGFFALGLALLQGILNPEELKSKLKIKCAVYVAPTFRHTHFNGRQIVVHNRFEELHEIFSYNLYPGPSAKKGIYGALINFGEKEGWITAHSSVVQVVTPYDNKIAIMHEGASGGGKSEMLEHLHREFDGSLLFGENIVNSEKKYLVIPRGCNLRPVTDDMTLCHPSIQKKNGKLSVCDAENSWFIRVDHITNYGTDPDIESRSIHPDEPLLFLNIDAQPNSTALLWDHIEDSPGKSCPNPRFILPRKIVPDVLNKPVQIDIRSFGVRTPPATAGHPNYGILGVFHIIPPALAWLWRLVSPRGHNNPSIVDSTGMGSEGIGSYWPFATGRKVPQANLLLEQILNTPNVHYVLCPNQHIGAWKVGFMPQWIMREYVARRGGIRFTKDEITSSRCNLLGYAISKLVIEGQTIDRGFLQVEYQPEVGFEAYDKGAKMLGDFFKTEISQFLEKDLNPLGKKIIDCCLSDGCLKDYDSFMEAENIFIED